MDPNTTLEQLREAVAKLQDGDRGIFDAAELVAELFPRAGRLAREWWLPPAGLATLTSWLR